MRVNNTRMILVSLMAVTSLVIAGCGGGGGSAVPFVAATQTVSGVAAAGSALIGQVSLVDAKGTLAPGSPMPLAANGTFAFNVFGMTPPFILKAEGTVGGASETLGTVGAASMTLYSAATGIGIANINPMSNIAVAAAAGVNDPADVFNNPVANAPKMTQASLNTAIANMQSMMANILRPYGAGSTNPITGSYVANHTGLDAAFDVVGMNLNTGTGTVTVMDKTAGMTGATIGTATLSQMMGTIPPAAVAAASNANLPNDLQGISAMLSNMATVLNKGINMTTTDLDPFFAPATGFGINNGMTRTQLMTNIQTATPLLLTQGAITGISNVAFNGNAPGGNYKIMFAFRFSDGSLAMANTTFADEMVVMKNLSTNAWQFTGNGMHSLMLNTMENQQWQTGTGTQTAAGLFFGMFDAGQVLKSAMATGPGLALPVSFVKDATNTMLVLATPSSLPSMGSQLFAMSDAAIAAIPDNARYTFSFYSSMPPRNNPMETRAMTFPKRCFTGTEAPANSGLFPTVTPAGNLNTHMFSTMMGNMMGGMMGGMLSMSFTYAAPAGSPSGSPVAGMGASYAITGTNTGFVNATARTLPLHGSFMTMQMTGPAGQAPTSGTGALDVHATDTFGRDAGTAWMFQ